MKSSVETFEEVRTSLSQWTKFTNDRDPRNELMSIEGDYIHRHHVEPCVQLYVPREETFPIPLRYIDVTKTTCTTLDVLQECRVGDYWNIDANRNYLPESWTGLTQFTMLHEKPPNGFLWSGRRLAKIQATTRPDHV